MAYTNSPLATVKIISPNKYAPRNHAIDTITLHCFVGQVTAKRGCEVFIPSSKQASCNYVVGYDGEIGLCVDEKDGSWCTSNKANDMRAITVEIASDTTHPYAITDKAMAATIKLCADICKRNGISKLVWSTDKATRMNHANGANMTVHRDYANKACPGDYIYQRLGYIAEEANKLIGAPQAATPAAPAVTGKELGEKEIWDALRNAGLTEAGTAGLMGNLCAESGLLANNLQNNGNSKMGLTDAQFTAKLDSGEYTRAQFISDGYGYGLAQWTYSTRKAALYDHMKKAGKGFGDAATQIEFLIAELKASFKPVWNALTGGAKTVKEASDIVLTKFEIPADQSTTAKNTRASYGQAYHDKYAGKAGGTGSAPAATAGSSYLVKITTSALNIRSGAGTGYKVVGTITDRGVYTIVDEANGAGASKWGKLKSGAGWISLDYASRI